MSQSIRQRRVLREYVSTVGDRRRPTPKSGRVAWLRNSLDQIQNLFRPGRTA